MGVVIRISVSSSLLGDYDEPEILHYATLQFCPLDADVELEQILFNPVCIQQL
jgi:hypothetical protein